MNGSEIEYSVTEICDGMEKYPCWREEKEVLDRVLQCILSLVILACNVTEIYDGMEKEVLE